MVFLDFPIRTDSLYPHSLYPPVFSRSPELDEGGAAPAVDPGLHVVGPAVKAVGHGQELRAVDAEGRPADSAARGDLLGKRQRGV